MIKNKVPVLTGKEKDSLYKLLNRTWLFDTILGSCDDEKEFKELNGIGTKQADKLLMKLLSVLART